MLIKIGAAVIVTLVLALSVTGFLLKNAYEDIGTLKSSVATAEAAVKEQRAVMVEIKAKYEAEQRLAAKMGEESRQAAQDRDRAVADLNAFRGKLARAAEGRPSLVGRLATRATRKIYCDIKEATGGEPCGQSP